MGGGGNSRIYCVGLRMISFDCSVPEFKLCNCLCQHKRLILGFGAFWIFKSTMAIKMSIELLEYDTEY